jgi:transcription initiation factor TFIID subunit 6
VEGVQPSIPQNPTTAEARAAELVPKGPGANPSLAALAGNDNAAFKPLVKHVVSKELILFFDKIKSAVLDQDADPEVVILREAALESVRSDPGLHQLVPYFVQFIAEKVTHSLNDTFILHQMMLLAAAMIDNKTLFIDPYVAALVPPVLTCLIGRRLGPEGSENLAEQYKLRDIAASLIGQMASKYGSSSIQLRPRLARTCLKIFLDPSRTLNEHYGAITGILAIGGADGVRSLILPNIKAYEYVITKAENERGQDDLEVIMVIAAVMAAVESIGGATAALGLMNGANSTGDETAQIKEYLGPLIGSRIAAKNDHTLNRALLAAQEKASKES